MLRCLDYKMVIPVFMRSRAVLGPEHAKLVLVSKASEKMKAMKFLALVIIYII